MAGKELEVFDSYAVAKLEGTSPLEVMRENVGAGGLTVFDLDRIKIPTGGGTMWTVPTLEGDTASKDVTGIVVAWREPRAFWRESFASLFRENVG